MSVIGPRPGLWNQDILTAERDKYGANDVKPGLTGWAQINGRDELEIPVKAKLDGEYVEKLALSYMKKDIPSDVELRRVIGGHLLDTYIQRFGFTELQAREAIQVYRERYAKVGIYKAELYPEFTNMVSGRRENE